MKIFVITSRIPYPLEKGDKLRIYHQLKELSKKHDIYLCALQSPQNKNIASAYSELSSFCKEVHFIKLSVIQITWSLLKSLFNKKPFQTALFTDAKAKRKVQKLIATINPNHIYCQLTRAAEYVRDCNYSKTIDYMDVFSKGMERRSSKSSPMTSWLYRWEAKKQKNYENEVFEHFNHHTIITEEDRSCISHPLKNNIQIVKNGVDFSFFSAQKSELKYDLVFVGNMGYAPNIDAAIYLCEKVLPLIQKQIPKVKVLLAGAEPSLSVKALQSEAITVSGWVKDIRSSYTSSKLCIAPMQIGTGLQNKLLEAMAMQVPCITTPLANKALKAPNDAILIGSSPEELANHCISLLRDEAKRKALSKQGLQFVKSNYQWSKTTETLSQLFLQ